MSSSADSSRAGSIQFVLNNPAVLRYLQENHGTNDKGNHVDWKKILEGELAKTDTTARTTAPSSDSSSSGSSDKATQYLASLMSKGPHSSTANSSSSSSGSNNGKAVHDLNRQLGNFSIASSVSNNTSSGGSQRQPISQNSSSSVTSTSASMPSVSSTSSSSSSSSDKWIDADLDSIIETAKKDGLVITLRLTWTFAWVNGDHFRKKGFKDMLDGTREYWITSKRGKTYYHKSSELSFLVAGSPYYAGYEKETIDGFSRTLKSKCEKDNTKVFDLEFRPGKYLE